MKFQGAVIKEQGVTFAVVVVQKRVIDNHSEADSTIRSLQPLFPSIPVILMVQDSRGVPTYYGKQDIAKFMASVSLAAIPWKEYTVNL